MSAAVVSPAIVDHPRDRAAGPRPRVVVIGGGIAGLAAAYRLTWQRPDVDILLLEREPRLGGKIVTEQRDGFVVEGGPEALLSAKPRLLELCHELGLGERLIGTNPAARRTFIRRKGRLQALPEGLSGMVPTRLRPIALSPLISPLGKLRMGLDLVLPAAKGDQDEPLAGFVERRLGREAYRWLVDPLVGGIYAGDGRRLSLAATAPHLRQMEREHGGLIRGALAAKRRATASPAPPPAFPFQAPRGGLGEIVASLRERLTATGVAIETGVAATAVRERDGGFEIACSRGDAIAADAVICATPAFVTAELLAGIDAEIASALRAIPYASVATVALAYPEQAIPRPIAGSGYLVPRAEGGPVNACTWVSAKWPARAPEGFALIRVSLGGAGREAALAASDEQLIAMAREEVRAIAGIEAAPTLARLFRWPQALPQCELGHLGRVAAIEARVADRYTGLALAGSAYRGAGLADCARSGEEAASRVEAFLAARAAEGAQR
jgi:oxygen-dependent protoporphyrinogen oxidase